MSTDGLQNSPVHFGKNLATVSAVLTIVLTALNAYWSNEVSEIENTVKMEAALIEKQRLEIEKDKERLSRYSFVQQLLADVLTQDQAQKTLTVNLISLALEEEEAKQLFSGLEASESEETQILGSIGNVVVATRAINNLVAQMNSAIKETRIDAVRNLIENYSNDPSAIEQALLLLSPDKIETVSENGRLNVLLFLSNTDKSAWTPKNISLAENTISLIRSRAEQGIAALGPKTSEALDEFSRLIEDLKIGVNL